MLYRVFDKIMRELWHFFHPTIWGKRLQINGVPSIIGIKNLELGMDVSINGNVTIQCSGGVQIGDRVTISRGTTILTAGLDTENYIENSKRKYRDHIIRKVVVGEGTWLAANVLVCPGARIGNNCIVAAGSVVAKDCSENNCIYGGVPAKMIKRL